MELEIINKKLVCVEYPAFVKNTDRMLQTLGGIDIINQVYNDKSKRLELKFRPDDPFSKCLHGDRVNTTNLLLKIVRRKNKDVASDPNASSPICKAEIVGKIDTTYKFRTMADFQYLPMIKKEDNSGYEPILEKLVPTGLVESSWLHEECPLFVLPSVFSRLDTPANYHFRGDSQKKQQQVDTDLNIIGRGRAKRRAGGKYISYEDPTPTKMSDITQAKAVAFNKITLEKLSEAFKERPIWSRSALAGIKHFEYNFLKKVLPCVAYYFLNGPWRGLWVRYGYDPRKEPESMKYQLVDLRLHITADGGIKFGTKRSIHEYKITTKVSGTGKKPVPGIIQSQLLASTSEGAVAGESTTSSAVDADMDPTLRYVFREGELPTYRQMFYHLCDIEMRAIQRLLAKEKGTVACSEKDGWCSPHFIEKARELILTDCKKTAEKMKREFAQKGNCDPSDEVMEEEEEEDLEEEFQEMELTSDLEDDNYDVEDAE